MGVFCCTLNVKLISYSLIVLKRCLLTQDVLSNEWGFIEYYLNEIMKNYNETITKQR